MDPPRVRLNIVLAWFYTSSYFSPTDAIPSFALMDIQGPVITTYVYQLIDNEVRVEKVEFRLVAVHSLLGYASLPLLQNHVPYFLTLPYPPTPHFSIAYTFSLVALFSRVSVLFFMLYDAPIDPGAQERDGSHQGAGSAAGVHAADDPYESSRAIGMVVGVQVLE
jgi:hypothetical protein